VSDKPVPGATASGLLADDGRPDPAVVDALRRALVAADYTVGAVSDLLGDDAHRALLRNETTPARRATADGSPLSTLTRLFALQLPVEARAAEAALPVDALVGVGLVERSADEVRALADVRAYGDEDHDWWVLCDLTPGLDGQRPRVGADHVLGISSASTSLAQLTVRSAVGSALDLGTGCGVQALHLAQHAERVVATDVNPRALAMARFTSALNDVAFEVRDGSLYEPVAGERFDLIATNPPFVVSPPATAGDGERLVYRDSGLPGDEVVRRVVTGAPAHLNYGGWCQVLANWVHLRGQDWRERLSGWLDPTCDAWVLQREEVDLPAYVEMWLTDAGLQGSPDYVRRYDAWLSWFDLQGIDAIGFGWISLRKAHRDQPVRLLEEWPYEVEQPVGPAIAAWAARSDAVPSTDDALAAMRLRQVAGLVQESVGEAGAADPERIVLRLQRGVRRARQVDTIEAGFVGACDGDLAVGQLLDALAVLTDADGPELRTTYLPVVRELVEEGFLEPA
jgi:hypothetical protein